MVHIDNTNEDFWVLGLVKIGILVHITHVGLLNAPPTLISLSLTHSLLSLPPSFFLLLSKTNKATMRKLNPWQEMPHAPLSSSSLPLSLSHTLSNVPTRTRRNTRRRRDQGGGRRGSSSTSLSFKTPSPFRVHPCLTLPDHHLDSLTYAWPWLPATAAAAASGSARDPSAPYLHGNSSSLELRQQPQISEQMAAAAACSSCCILQQEQNSTAAAPASSVSSLFCFCWFAWGYC